MSWASTEGSRRSMKGNRRRDTKPELAVRRALHAEGFRYRVDFSPLGGRRRADIVFTRRKLAVYIDGCFWHGCPQHATMPRRNADYWVPKLAHNIERDRLTDADLRAAGWTVRRFWEHQSPAEIVHDLSVLVRPHALSSPSCAESRDTEQGLTPGAEIRS